MHPHCPRRLATILAVLTVATAAATALPGQQGAASQPGLLGEYFVAKGLEGDAMPVKARPFLVRVDPQVNFASVDGEFYKSKLSDQFFVRWTGSLRIEQAGEYTFATTSDDGSRLYIDGHRVVDNWGPHGMTRKSGSLNLTAGDHRIRVSFQEGGGGAGCIVGWIPPGGSESAIPAGSLFHSEASATAARQAWDQKKWQQTKLRKKKRGASGRSFTSSMGPVVATAIRLGRTKHGDNTVYRGLVVRLDADGKSCMVFDADTMRMAGAWTDGSLELAGLPFTAAHGAFPAVGGETVFQLGARPGWARGGSLTDPRRGAYPPLGHLPKDWAHYKGLYMAGDRVVLRYTVGKSEVWEVPSLALDGDHKTVLRELRIRRDGSAMSMVLADADPGSVVESAVAMVGDRSGKSVTMIGANSTSGGVLAVRDGVVVLDLPAAKGVTRVQIAYARRAPDGAAEFRDRFVKRTLGTDVMALTRGGAKRWPKTFKTRGEMAPAALAKKQAYVVDRVTVPFKNDYEPRMRIGGLDFFSDGRAAVSTWDGDVWVVSGIAGDLQDVEWKRYATGLHEPLGLCIVDDVVYTVDDMQITRLHDLNQDGEADFFENFNNDWQLTSGFHAFCFDLQTDAQGNFYFAFGSPVRGGGRSFERMGDHHGSILRVSRDGLHLDQYASGLRAPNGIGVSAAGQVTSSDNEGTFMPRCPINWISEGEFCGVADSAELQLREKMRTTATRGDRVPRGRARELDASEMPKPMVWLPKGVDNSGGGQVWVTSKRWGPLTGELMHMSYGKSSLFLVLKERKGELMQGGVVKLPLKFSSSAMRARFHPVDGQLFVAGLRGWQTNAVKEGGLDRVRYTGVALAMPVGLRTSKGRIEITFSEKLDPELANDPESFGIRAADVLWTHDYGSNDYKIGQRGKGKDAVKGWSDLEVTGAKLLRDGKTIALLIPGLQPAHEMEISIDVETASGNEIRTKIWNTIHVVD